MDNNINILEWQDFEYKHLLIFFHLDQRTTVGDRQVAASWSDTGNVHIWDLSDPLQALESPAAMAKYMRQNNSKPLYTFNGHVAEGYALDWSPTVPGKN